MQKEILDKILLLDNNGELIAPGYAKKYNYVYNRNKAHKFPLRLKEWNFYQFQKGSLALQLTLGHVSYMCSVSATLFDIETNERFSVGKMLPFFNPNLDLNPEENSYNEFNTKNFHMSFEVKDNERILYLKAKTLKYRNVEIKLNIENDPNNEKMVIATPFKEKKDQFYLNYKENYYKASGYARFDDYVADFKESTGLLDWGRGIWPYRHEWFWGSVTTIHEGVPLGFNIGWGFGDLSNATENMYFYDKKAYKVGELEVIRDEYDYLSAWKLKDKEGKFELFFLPVFDNYTQNKLLVVDTHCNQVFGHFSGYMKTEDGIIRFENILGFIEHAVNRW